MIDRISIDARICGGKACVRGTRVPVHVILDFLAAGNTIDAILAEYPQLAREDMLAAIGYEAMLARDEVEFVEES